MRKRSVMRNDQASLQCLQAPSSVGVTGTILHRFVGHRQVLLTPESSMFSWLKSHEKNAQLADVGLALKDLTPESFKSLMSHVKLIFVGTVSPGDFLCIPPGYIICERAQGKSSVGIFQRLLLQEHTPELTPLVKELGARLPAKHVLRAISAARRCGAAPPAPSQVRQEGVSADAAAAEDKPK